MDNVNSIWTFRIKDENGLVIANLPKCLKRNVKIGLNKSGEATFTYDLKDLYTLANTINLTIDQLLSVGIHSLECLRNGTVYFSGKIMTSEILFNGLDSTIEVKTLGWFWLLGTRYTGLTSDRIFLNTDSGEIARRLIQETQLGISSQGANSATTYATEADLGTEDWNLPTSQILQDGWYIVGLDNIAGVNTSYYLKATGFNFNIPAGKTILGIVAEIKMYQARYSVSGYAFDTNVRILKNGVRGSTNKGNNSDISEVDAYYPYGSSFDLWGETWSPSDINDPDFGITIEVAGELSVVYLDDIRVTVYYGETDPENDLGIIDGTIEASVSRTLSFTRKNIKEAIEELSNADSGFDFEIEPDTKVFNVFYPFKGEDKSGTVKFFYPSKVVQSIEEIKDATKIANSVLISGKGLGDQEIYAQSDDIDSQGAFGLRQAILSFKDIDNAIVLVDIAEQYLQIFKSPNPVYKITVHGNDSSPSLDDYSVGDYIDLVIREDWYTLERALRVFEIDIDIDDKDQETIELVVGLI